MIVILLATLMFLGAEQQSSTNHDHTAHYDDKGADFAPWIRHMLSQIGRTLLARMPWAANNYHGHVVVGLRVARDGTILDYQTLEASGVPELDDVAAEAVHAADLLPLPDDYPDEIFAINFAFWYNEQAYGLAAGKRAFGPIRTFLRGSTTTKNSLPSSNSSSPTNTEAGENIVEHSCVHRRSPPRGREI